ncbi:hypothetical protein [Carnobacterium divergens]|uniref:Uncharacterized protein n=2 Tax=Carnobacterium divergens TaxID=2748 RepID=A0A0R2HQ51_CARDV|nr:hypothetical protein [Carnobacterium divergens]KRN54590.1 hypothetical protein IV74_GL002174 [Carnobacterium divergens DSM 20623]MDO0874075.1 hypothetical protein [Carnobacterium divergens]SUX20488.1 Uncharacterised protein [Carnobacterium divergens]
MFLLLKIVGILGLTFCTILLFAAIKMHKLNSKKFHRKAGLILLVSLFFVLFSQMKINQINQKQKAAYTIASKSTLDGSQTFLRVLVFSHNKKDIEQIFKKLQKSEKNERTDSLFVRFNVDNGGEIGEFIANAKIAWTLKGEEQVDLKKDQEKIEFNNLSN